MLASICIRIDLRVRGIEFVVTPRTQTDDFEQSARTTSQFLSEFDVQVAINGDFFDPGFEYGPFNYYPQTGDGVNMRGVSIANGQEQSAGYSPNFQTLSVLSDSQIIIGAPMNEAQTAISGYLTPVRDGSTTLVMENAMGQPRVLNSPIHGRIPGMERPIGNHFGVRATHLTTIDDGT